MTLMQCFAVEKYGSVNKVVAFLLADHHTSRRGYAVPAYTVNGVSFSWSQVSHCWSAATHQSFNNNNNNNNNVTCKARNSE